jgi:hypothetical protein
VSFISKLRICHVLLKAARSYTYNAPYYARTSCTLIQNTVACGPVARQRPRNEQLHNSRWIANCRISITWASQQTRTQQSNGVLYAVRAEILYKQDSWSNELAVGQSLASKNVSTETEDIVEIRHQASTAEDSRLKRFVRAVVNCSDSAVVTCNYRSINSITNPNRVYSHIHTRENTIIPAFLKCYQVNLRVLKLINTGFVNNQFTIFYKTNTSVVVRCHIATRVPYQTCE